MTLNHLTNYNKWLNPSFIELHIGFTRVSFKSLSEHQWGRYRGWVLSILFFLSRAQIRKSICFKRCRTIKIFRYKEIFVIFSESKVWRVSMWIRDATLKNIIELDFILPFRHPSHHTCYLCLSVLTVSTFVSSFLPLPFVLPAFPCHPSCLSLPSFLPFPAILPWLFGFHKITPSFLPSSFDVHASPVDLNVNVTTFLSASGHRPSCLCLPSFLPLPTVLPASAYRTSCLCLASFLPLQPSFLHLTAFPSWPACKCSSVGELCIV